MSVSEFFHMGGYAVFVWSSMGLTFVVLLLNWLIPYQRHKQNLRKLQRQFLIKSREERNSNDSGT